MLGEPIGAGAAATVWRARVAEGSRSVAIKLVSRRGDSLEAWQAEALSEVRALASVDHDHVVQVLDYGLTDRPVGDCAPGALWIATELADGSAAKRSWDWPGLRRLLEQSLLGLAHVHAKGLVHRDVKPANVLRFKRANGLRWKVADFGLAVVHDQESGSAASSVGTPAYMAPEQIQGLWWAMGPWTDLYALGCLGWEIATGGTPHLGPGTAAVLQQHLTGSLPPFRPMIPVPEGLEGWLRQCLARTPTRRFSRASDARRMLERAAATPMMLPVDPLAGADWVGSAETLLPTDSNTVSFDPVLDGEVPDPDDVPSVPGPLDLYGGPPPFPQAPSLLPTPTERSAAMASLRSLQLVGREAECGALWQVLVDSIEQQAARVVLIRGAPGMGRTRLLEWLAVQGHEAGWVERFDAGAGSDRLAEMVHGELGTRGDRREAVLLRARERMGSEAGGSLVQALADVAVGGSWEQGHGRLLLPALTALARGRCALVAVDDAETDPELLRWVLQGARFAAGPVVFALVLPDGKLAEAVAPLVERLEKLGAKTVAVGPLEPGAQRALLRGRFGLGIEATSVAAGHAGGSPALAVELVEAWWREDRLVAGPDGWEGVSLDELDISLEVTGSWRRALGQAFADAGRDPTSSVAVAVLVGTWVDEALWITICRAAGIEPMWSGMRVLGAQGVLRRERGGWRWAVESARLALRGLVKSEELARLAGVAAEVMHARGEDRQAGELWVLAGELGLAEPLLLGVALRLSNDRRHLDTLAVLDSVDLVHRRMGRTEVHPKVLDLRALALIRLGRHAHVAQMLEGHIPRPEDVHSFSGMITVPSILASQGHFDAEWALALLDRGEQLPDLQPHDVCSIHLNQGSLRLELGQLEAGRAALEQAVTEAADPNQEIFALCALSGAYGRLGRLPEARQTIERALDLVVEHDQPAHDEAFVLDSLGHIVDRMGEPEKARELMERALAIHRRLGDAVRMSDTLNNVAEMDRRAGRLDEAEAKYREATDRLMRAGYDVHPVLLANLGLVYVERRDRTQAWEVLSESLERLRAHKQWSWVGVVAGLALPALVEDPEAYDALLAERVQLLEETKHSDRDVVRTLLIAAGDLRELGDVPRARRTLAAAAVEAEAVGMADLQAEVRAAQAELDHAGD